MSTPRTQGYVIARGRRAERQYYRWSDDAFAVVWQPMPSGATWWTSRIDAERVAAMYAGARVVRRERPR